MNDERGATAELLDERGVQAMRRRVRLIQLLDAAERAAIAPVSASLLHALAYLADVLSPVWELSPFDGKILKSKGGPHYPDLQRDLDRLVVLGLVEITNLTYQNANHGAQLDGDYALRFKSSHLAGILAAVGPSQGSLNLDPADQLLHSYLVELAGALATLPQAQIEKVASADPTYADDRIGEFNIIDFGSWTREPRIANLSSRTAERFRSFLPHGSSLSPSEKLYLYASYLGRRIRGG